MSNLRFPLIMWLSEAERTDKLDCALVCPGNAFHLGIERHRLGGFINQN
jgi:hypothetical protein